jgi:hypothetical protein
LKNKEREPLSSLACFKDYKTLVSYVPKKNKSVILLSTFHHVNNIVTSNKKKPQIVLDYNRNKGFI